MVWDLEHIESSSGNSENSTAIIFKPLSEDPISSIAWMSDPHLLAVGTSLNSLKIYDIRLEPNSAETFSISAHMAPVRITLEIHLSIRCFVYFDFSLLLLFHTIASAQSERSAP